MILLLIVGFGLTALIELPGLLQRKNRREVLLFAALLGLGFTLSVLMELGVQFPEVTTTLNHFYKKLMGE